MQLVDLVEAHPVLFSKATNASNNQLKEATWLKITNTFNSMVASNPRKPEQLRLKWENLKKAARKRSTKIRMNNIKVVFQYLIGCFHIKLYLLLSELRSLAYTVSQTAVFPFDILFIILEK